MNRPDYSNALPAGFVLTDGDHRYTIQSVLGKGGFGITYRVVTDVNVGNLRVQVTLAVKEHFVSELSARSDSGAVESSTPVRARVDGSLKDFLSEARRLRDLSGLHPSIVNVNSAFEANNTAYYTMEFIDGPGLNQIIASRGRLPETEALGIIRPVIEAVASIHDARMTHLDIKPANILIATDNAGRQRPVLIDFGLAKHYDSAGNATSTLNTIGCSEGFAPLEQYLGLTTFSPTADVYALGATLYNLLTGQRPPAASDVDINVLDSTMTAVGVSPSTRAAICRAMALRPADRFADARAFLASIDGTSSSSKSFDPFVDAEETNIIIERPTTPSPVERKSKTRKTKVMDLKSIIIIVAVVVIAILGIIMWNNSRRDKIKSVLQSSPAAQEENRVEQYSAGPDNSYGSPTNNMTVEQAIQDINRCNSRSELNEYCRNHDEFYYSLSHSDQKRLDHAVRDRKNYLKLGR